MRVRRAPARRALGLLTAIATCLILASGDAGQSIPPKPSDFVQRLLSSMAPADRTTLLDIHDYLSNPQSPRGALWDLQQRLIQECMRRAGFRYHRVPYRPLTVDLTGGYGPRPGPEVPATRAPEGVSSDRNASGFEQDEWQVAYSNNSTEVLFSLPGGGQGGSATGGCLGESLYEIYGNDLAAAIRADMVVTNLLPMIVKLTITSDQVQAAAGRWRECVGRDLPHAVALPRTYPSTTALAPADAGCRRLAGLTGAYEESFPPTAYATLRMHADVIADWRRFRSAAHQVVETTRNES
ncbi:hypothetical protein ABT008_26170 [Micromonospora sp. NPDC002389]|uniref:hypothetical protein n=1 Tax=Micromonospora sp. NPDC002389 TaxID=3154272 RepID=UPI003331606D